MILEGAEGGTRTLISLSLTGWRVTRAQRFVPGVVKTQDLLQKLIYSWTISYSCIRPRPELFAAPVRERLVDGR
jgi:hypothetical protein